MPKPKPKTKSKKKSRSAKEFSAENKAFQSETFPDKLLAAERKATKVLDDFSSAPQAERVKATNILKTVKRVRTRLGINKKAAPASNGKSGGKGKAKLGPLESLDKLRKLPKTLDKNLKGVRKKAEGK